MGSSKSKIKILIIVIALYVSTHIFSDLLALKIISTPIFKFSVTAGIILYPLTFTIRDIAHKILGRKNVRYLIVFTVLLNIIMIALLYLVVLMDPSPYWDLQESFRTVFSPVWRITLASIFAEFISQIADTYIFSRLYRKDNFGMFAVIGSNLASSILDSVLFVIVAFFGTIHIEVLIEIILVQTLLKILLSVLIAPAIKFVPLYVTKEEV